MSTIFCSTSSSCCWVSPIRAACLWFSRDTDSYWLCSAFSWACSWTFSVLSLATEPCRLELDSTLLKRFRILSRSALRASSRPNATSTIFCCSSFCSSSFRSVSVSLSVVVATFSASSPSSFLTQSWNPSAFFPPSAAAVSRAPICVAIRSAMSSTAALCVTRASCSRPSVAALYSSNSSASFCICPCTPATACLAPAWSRRIASTSCPTSFTCL